MPALFDIRSEGGGYTIMCERDALMTTLPQMGDGLVIADDYFAGQFHARDIQAIGLPASETTKSLDAIGDVIVQMRKAGATRDTRLWAVGGGAIQDVACFVASVYMRGIPWTYVPTTLLGMVDSCIGGKSSINVGAYKNILGSFHPPDIVWIDPELTATLSAEQLVAGLVEAAKICFCRGASVFETYLSHAPDPGLTPVGLEPIIALSLGAKKWFVEIDEFDRAERQLLNLGHTFGHALEGASDYRLSHGIAVGVGVLCALNLSRDLLGAPPGGAASRLGQHMRGLLGAVPGLALILRAIEVPVTLDRVKADKKHQPTHYRFVTFNAEGKTQLTSLPKTAATDAAISAALSNTLELFLE